VQVDAWEPSSLVVATATQLVLAVYQRVLGFLRANNVDHSALNYNKNVSHRQRILGADAKVHAIVSNAIILPVNAY
jgi:hypothetical protein